jgi:hypothetical protein
VASPVSSGRILLVHESEPVCRALTLIFAYDAHEVRRARTPASAVRLLREFRPHLVVADPHGAIPLSLIGAAMTRDDLGLTGLVLTGPRTLVDASLQRWVVAEITPPFDFMGLRSLVCEALAARLPVPPATAPLRPALVRRI